MELETQSAPEFKIDFSDDGSFHYMSMGILGFAWRKIVQNYTSRELTEETDKLKAISPIAEAFLHLTWGISIEQGSGGRLWSMISRGLQKTPGL